MASRRSRAHHHPPRTPDVESIRRRNKALMFIVLVLFAFLLVYNRRNQRRVELARQEARVQDAFLELGGALERYRTDFGAYPLKAPGIYSASGIARLTTPHPYLWDPLAVTLDPFSQASLRVAILDTTPARWLLISAGPDRKWDLAEATLLHSTETSAGRGTDVEYESEAFVNALSLLHSTARPLGEPELRQLLSLFRYDPTNGSLSRGDLLLLGK